MADNDPELANELVSLLRINQHSAIVIDSDRAKARQHINKTKQRIREECGNDGRLCWITDGREIENYLPPEVLAKAFAGSVNSEQPPRFGPYEKIEAFLKRAYGRKAKTSRFYDHAKVQKAREIAGAFETEDFSKKLGKRMETLVADIRGSQA